MAHTAWKPIGTSSVKIGAKHVTMHVARHGHDAKVTFPPTGISLVVDPRKKTLLDINEGKGSKKEVHDALVVVNKMVGGERVRTNPTKSSKHRKNPVISLTGDVNKAHVQQAVAAAGFDPRKIKVSPAFGKFSHSYQISEIYNFDDYEDAELEPGEYAAKIMRKKLPGWKVNYFNVDPRPKVTFEMTPPR